MDPCPECQSHIWNKNPKDGVLTCFFCGSSPGKKGADVIEKLDIGVAVNARVISKDDPDPLAEIVANVEASKFGEAYTMNELAASVYEADDGG